MAYTPEQIEAMEEENMIQAVLDWEEEMQGSDHVRFIPQWPEDGEETDAQNESLDR